MVRITVRLVSKPVGPLLLYLYNIIFNAGCGSISLVRDGSGSGRESMPDMSPKCCTGV